MEKLDKVSFRRQHHSRNAGLLNETDQDKISEQVLLLAGCGVGSQIALSATRIGFENFILVDGDTVELSNINRQGYSWRDVGRYKVDALARKIKAINPHAHIRKYPIFVDIKNASKLVNKSTIVIDAIDPDAFDAEIAMHRIAKKQNKFVLQPADAGWGAFLYIYDPKGTSYDEIIKCDHMSLETIQKNKSELYGRVIEHLMVVMPKYAKKIGMDLMEGKLEHYPQPVSAAYILSALTVVAAKRIALGLPVKTAPEYVLFDPNIMLDPNAEV